MRAARAWSASVLCCAATMVVTTTVLDAMAGRWPPSLHNVLDFTAAVTAAFGFVAALVFGPVFLLVGRVPRWSRDWRPMAIAGALLALLVVIAFRVTFAEFGDPATALGWVRHFVRNPGELAGSVVLAVPAVTFGLVWARRRA